MTNSYIKGNRHNFLTELGAEILDTVSEITLGKVFTTTGVISGTRVMNKKAFIRDFIEELDRLAIIRGGDGTWAPWRQRAMELLNQPQMRVFVVFINAGYSGWEHHVVMACSPEEASDKAKAKSLIAMSKVIECVVNADYEHLIIAGGP